MQKRDLSEKTIDQYMRASRMFLDVVHKNLRNVVPTDIEYYLNEFARGKLKVNSPQSVNNERQFLSSVFTWLRRCNFITSNPVENVAKKKVPRKPIDFLQGIEVQPAFRVILGQPGRTRLFPKTMRQPETGLLLFSLFHF